MKLFVISYKVGWQESESKYGTFGGFPFQMEAVSNLFDETIVTLLLRPLPSPAGVQVMTGKNLKVFPLPEPRGVNLRRKLSLLSWIPCYFPRIWREVQRADAVHVPAPGDIGFIGILIALLQQKPLFVRHCGTWGVPVTTADKILLWLLERIAGGRNVVLATGGSDCSPSVKNPHIQWIFSTTLTSAELERLPHAMPWRQDKPLRLITVCRLSAGKNVQAVIQAMQQLQSYIPNIFLDIVGDGEYRPALEKLTADLNMTDKITFHGNVSHKAVLKALAQAHLFVFPTQVKEGFPKAVLEALACGLPVVATNVSTLPYLLKGCGHILSGTAPEDVTHGILELTRDSDRMAEMSSIAIDRSRQYSLEKWRDMIHQHLQLAWGQLNEHDSPSAKLDY